MKAPLPFLSPVPQIERMRRREKRGLSTLLLEGDLVRRRRRRKRAARKRRRRRMPLRKRTKEEREI